MPETPGESSESPKTRPTFGEVVRKPSKKDGKLRERAADFHEPAELALHIKDLTPKKPIKFPDPRVVERDGKRFTTIGKGAYLYDLPTGRQGPNGEWRKKIGEIENPAEEAEYIKRWPHPASEKIMPSIELRFSSPITLRDTRTGEIVEFQGIAYGDRVGEDWEGMIEPSTTRKMREEREGKK